MIEGVQSTKKGRHRRLDGGGPVNRASCLLGTERSSWDYFAISWRSTNCKMPPLR